MNEQSAWYLGHRDKTAFVWGGRRGELALQEAQAAAALQAQQDAYLAQQQAMLPPPPPQLPFFAQDMTEEELAEIKEEGAPGMTSWLSTLGAVGYAAKDVVDLIKRQMIADALGGGGA